MIAEDFVSFETAKLLKEKGFDVYVRSFYEKNEHNTKEEFSTNNALWNYNISSLRYSVPTLQMAMKWLRDIHGLFIHIDVIREASCWTADIQDIKNDVAVYPVKEEFPGYEEACEAAIKYCLEKLI